MDPVSAEVLCAILQLPESITVEGVYPTKTQLTVQIACILESAACPLCQQPSERIHGSYRRRVADVPCGGRKVILALTVRDRKSTSLNSSHTVISYAVFCLKKKR